MLALNSEILAPFKSLNKKYLGWFLKVAVNYWEASPNASNTNNFCNVNIDGTANNNNANNDLGIAPDFIGHDRSMCLWPRREKPS
jgi:hypothetical protein